MTIINLKIDAGEQKEYGPYRDLKVVADKQIYDTYDDEEISEFNYSFEETSLTSLYEKLYDISQSQDIIPKDVAFHIDGEEFCKMVGGFHLALNDEFPSEIANKYSVEQRFDLLATDTIKKAYSKPEVVDGLIIQKDDDEIYFKNSSANSLKSENGDTVFKNENDVKEAIRFYFSKDSDAHVPYLDKVSVYMNDVNILNLEQSKIKDDNLEQMPKLEFNKEEIKQEQKRKSRIRP